MKEFLINIFLPFGILFLLFLAITIVGFSLGYVSQAITSKPWREKITSILFACGLSYGFYHLLKWIINYWRQNKNYTKTYVIVFASIIGLLFLWVIYVRIITTREKKKYQVKHAVTNSGYQSEPTETEPTISNNAKKKTDYKIKTNNNKF